MIRLVLLLALLCSSTLTLAQGGTITSGPATFYRSFDLGRSVELKGVSTYPTYSQLSDFGWWYRVNGDPTQYPFPTPTLEAYPGNTSTRSWLNVNGRGFNAREVCTLVGTAAPAGGALSCTMTLINPAAVPLSINLFVAANIALPLGNPTDSATLGVANQRIDIAAANGLTRARFHGIGAAAYAVSGAFGGISNLLNNGSLTNFTNTGLPSGPISFWGGYQWKLIVAGNSSRDATSLIEIITDPVNGVCATIPPQTSVTVPAFGACVTGVGSAPLIPTLANYTWTCSGNNGGISSALNGCSTPRLYIVSTATGGGGTIACAVTPGGTLAATTNATSTNSLTCTAVPSGGFATQSITGCSGAPTGPGVNTYNFGPVSSNCTVTANFVSSGVLANGACGVVAPSLSSPSSGLCSAGTPSAVSANTNDFTWGCNGVSGGMSTGASACSNPRLYTVSVIATPNGSMTCARVSVPPSVPGSTATAVSGVSMVTCTTTPNANYTTASISGCGGVATGNGVNSYTFGPITANCAVLAGYGPAVVGACGSANGVGTNAAPSANLCATGAASAVTSGVNHQWTCSGSLASSAVDDASCSAPNTTPTPINGFCGAVPPSANLPAAGLCSSGTATAITSNTNTFNWGCNGLNGGTSTAANACSNARQYTVTAVAGVGGSMLCRDDTSTPIGAYGSSVLIPALFGIGQCDAVPDPGFATQSITGACGQLVAVGGDIFEVKKGLSADCTVTANFVAAAAGSCGSANGVSTVAPPASNLCSTGTASAVAAGVGGANHTWSCLGTNPASTSDDAFCAAPSSLTAVNGTCNTNVDFGYVPPTTGLCNVGTATPVTTNPTNFTWGCNGANGGGSTAPNACNTLRKYTVLAVNGSPGGTVVCGNDSLFAAKPNTLTAVIGGTGPIICTATAEPGFSVQSISGCGGVATGPGVISYPFNATPANCTVTANYVGAAITAADAQPVPSNTSAALVLMLMSLLGIGAVALRKRNAV